MFRDFEQLKHNRHQRTLSSNFSFVAFLIDFFISFFVKTKKILDILLSKSAEVDFGDHEDKTSLHVAAEMGHKHCVTMLGVASPGSVNSTDERGRSPLHHAAINGHA